MMKKQILLIPLMFILTGCVMYNGQGKPGTKSSAAPISQEPTSVPADNSNESQPAEQSQPGEQSNPAPTSSSQAPASDPTPASSDELPAGSEVTIYLVFGEYGLLDGQPVNDNVPELFLEHALKRTMKVGDLLPGDLKEKDIVTSSVTGSHFVCWTAYNNDGKLTEYLKVPGYQNKILYASFSGGQGGGSSSGQQGGGGEVAPSTPGEYTPASTGALPTFGYGFKFSDGSYMAAVKTNDDNGFQQYLIEHRQFKKDETFQLYDFENNAGWTVAVDPYSFGGDSGTSTNHEAYLFRNTSNQTYKVLQDFNVEAIYIKLKFGEDQIYFQLGN